MALLIHIIIALGSIAFTTYLLFSPTEQKLKVSYGFIALTLISGTFLAISDSALLLHACVSGLVYVSVITAITAAAHVRLTRAGL